MNYPDPSIPQSFINSSKKSAERFVPIWRQIVARHPGVAFDIGAYVGVYSLLFKSLGFDVYAFEPSKEFQRALGLITPGKVHQVAFSDVNSTVECALNDCTKSGDLSYGLQTVTYRIFDEYFAEANLPDPTFVKIDIEGMETLAMKGMANLIAKRPFFQIEYHSLLSYKGKNYPGFVPVSEGGFDFQVLEDAEFNIRDYEFRPCKAKEMKGNNYFFLPAEKDFTKRMML